MKYFIKITALFVFLFQLTITTAIASQTLSVNGIVPPQPIDFQLSIHANPQFPTEVYPNESIPFTITYGAKASAGMSTATTITVSWQGIVAQDGTQMGEYQEGSATSAFNNTPPIINSLDKTITWDISSLPAGVINQTLQLSLRVTNNYQKTENVPWIITAKMHNQYTTISDQQIRDVLYHAQSKQSTQQTTQQTPTTIVTPSTSTEANTATTQSLISPANARAITLSPSPTTEPLPPSISFTTISDNAVIFTTKIRNPKKLIVKYGQSLNHLSQTIMLSSTTEDTTMKLDGLDAATNYFIQVDAIDQTNTKVSSEIYTFKTAEQSDPLNTANDITVISSNDTIIFANGKDQAEKKTQTALITENIPYEIAYTINNKTKVKTIDAIVRKRVLGINTFSPMNEQAETVIPMIEKSASLYVASITPFAIGTFDILVRIIDENGNLKEEKIAETRVMKRFVVSDKTTQKPLSDARVFLSVYNNKTNQYEPIKNPSYTDTNGELPLVLPANKYKAVIGALGYNEQTIFFTIGTQPNEIYPNVLLEKDQTIIRSAIRYIEDTIIDFTNKGLNLIHSLSFSLRFFNLLAVFIVLCFIIINYILFFMKIKLHPKHTISYFIHHTQFLFNKKDLVPFEKTLVKSSDNSQDNNDTRTILHAVRDIAGMFFETSMVLSLVLEIFFFSLFGLTMTLPFFCLSLFNIVLWVFSIHSLPFSKM
jgi:hypothetical protein